MMDRSIVLICPVFFPDSSSAGVQLWDLASEFVNQGYNITVCVPSCSIKNPYVAEKINGVDVLRVRAPKARDTSYIRRTVAEFLTPYFMIWNLRRYPYFKMKWDGIVWYSPSIFLTPLVRYFKKNSKCRTYLIVRDIFPEWAVNLGLMRKGLPYLFFKLIEYSQYKIADSIGVQTQGNLDYFSKITKRYNCKIEVLQNWLASGKSKKCSIDLKLTYLAGKKIFVYAGNMGVAQGLDLFICLAQKIQKRKDIGFLFVGRGSEKHKLEKMANKLNLDNILFLDEIKSSEIPGLYKQCAVGIVSLDKRHVTHNIPGKFLSYMDAGLPVLALVNKGNDLIELVNQQQVGFATCDYSVETLEASLEQLVENLDTNIYSVNCRNLSTRLFSPAIAVRQIADKLFTQT